MTSARRTLIRAAVVAGFGAITLVTPSSGAQPTQATEEICAVCGWIEYCPDITIQDDMCKSACGWETAYSDDNCSGEHPVTPCGAALGWSCSVY